MTNMYIEYTAEENNTNDVKEFNYFINTDIEDNGIVKIETFIKYKHFHFKELVKNFNIVLNAVKSFNPESPIEEIAIDEESYTITTTPEDSTISVTILDSNFDLDSLVQGYTYAVGYLQSCMLNCGVEG